jgi:hypothetical protein
MLDVQQRGRLAVIQKIIEGSEAGFYDLPDEVRQAATWFPTFTDRVRETRQKMEDIDPGKRQAAYIDATVTALKSGRPIPDAAAMTKARDAWGDLDYQVRVLRDTEESVANAAISTVAQHAETIVVDYLRPAFEKVLSEAKDCTGLLHGMTTAQEVMSSQNIETIRAWMGLQRLAVSRAAIRGAYDSLKRLWGYTTEDINGVFMSYRNGDALRPGPGKPIPTFEDGAERLAWEVVNEAEVWLPLAHEQDDALADYVARTKAKTAPVAV